MTTGINAKPQSLTLSNWLTTNNKTVADLAKAQSWELNEVARELLKAKGVESPTNSQLDETLFQLGKALKEDSWQDFSAPFTAAVLKLEDGLSQRLGNIFMEKRLFNDPSDLLTENLKLGSGELQTLRGGFESGRTGMILAATLIPTALRSEGDFTRAYGDKAWRGFVRASTYLDAIPKGKLLESLDVEMLKEINRRIHAPDLGLKAAILRTASAAWRGKWDKGGVLRDGRQFSRPQQYRTAEIDVLKQQNIRVQMLGVDYVNDGLIASLEYPPPSQVLPRLTEIIATLKSDLASPTADPVAASAKFQRSLVALHPFPDSNGRTSRILLNRLLAEFDLPPAIFSDLNRDLSLTATEWETEVREGIARAKEFLSTRMESRDDYLSGIGIKALPQSPDQPLVLDGNPFDLGADGFLYDPTGRPWLASANEIIPLSQLEHFVIARRLTQMGKAAGTEALIKLTAETRGLYDRVAKDPKLGEQLAVLPDDQARKADASYKLAPHPEVAKVLVDLARIDRLDPAKLFVVEGARSGVVSSTISKHTQVDLELWYLEQGLKDTNQPSLASAVRAQRQALFALAKARVEKAGDKDRVTPENPLGFKFKYEKMMFEASPLKSPTLEAAIAAYGDEKVTVWRGDYSFARLIGMAPNNDVRQSDARAVAKQRADKMQLTNIYDDLVKLEGSAIGRQYISTTSDLGLLTGSFANSAKSQTVNAGKLPAVIRDHLFSWIGNEENGLTWEQKDAARKEIDAGKDWLVSSPDGGRELRNLAGIPGTVLTVSVKDKEAAQLTVGAKRKAFELVLDKNALLPGVYSLGEHSFAREQELHGLERVYPWAVKGVFTADAIGEELPLNENAKKLAPAAAVSPAAAVALAVSDAEAEAEAEAAAGEAPSEGP